MSSLVSIWLGSDTAYALHVSQQTMRSDDGRLIETGATITIADENGGSVSIDFDFFEDVAAFGRTLVDAIESARGRLVTA